MGKLGKPRRATRLSRRPDERPLRMEWIAPECGAGLKEAGERFALKNIASSASGQGAGGQFVQAGRAARHAVVALSVQRPARTET